MFSFRSAVLRAVRTSQRSFGSVASTASAASTSSASAAPSAAAAAAVSPSPVKQLSWKVTRTPSKKLPVYSDFHGTQKLTVVRRCEGSSAALAAQLRLLVGPKPVIEERVGKIVVSGDHTGKVRSWLEGLGF